ncbi:hypothetical protein AJ80_03980 [Polytolypa hystricis UAMH7299]|uniref:DUF4238 domain-containing protein n=1 Tax=Polytolypa hystricis (strain UAMH7299) TaxID=1447883 RepID=A0A2B7YDR9_POLH7|nr:hypothetical protein AJ80_03980 [Polytolypa hystricis UAMH7299]
MSDSELFSKSKDMEQDQYQHYVPRFILKTFAEGKNINIYSPPTDSQRTVCLDVTFGELNLYRTTSRGDDIENRLMRLESLAGQAFSDIKKAAAGSSGNTVKLFDSDIDTIKKFFAISNLRTTGFRNHTTNVYTSTDLPDTISNEQRETRREMWLDMLRYLLPTASENRTKFADQDSSGTRNCPHEKQSDIIANAIRVCNNIAGMQMYIWKSPQTKEFLLGDPLVRTETVDNITDKNNPRCAHLFFPISPTVAIVLCDKLRCTPTRSMISRAAHASPQPHVLPGRKKPGQHGYRKPRKVWIYPITSSDERHLLVLNHLTIPSIRVVFRNGCTIREAINSLVSFQRRFDAHRKALGSNCNAQTAPKTENSEKERRKSLLDHGFRLIQFMKLLGAPENLVDMMYSVICLLRGTCWDCDQEILEEVHEGLKSWTPFL